MEKRIVCYGDSNTWGNSAEMHPADNSYEARFPADIRWTGVLAGELGDGYTILEEGLNARTSSWDDPLWADRNGLTQLIPTLDVNSPVDLVILMLGTNDLKKRISCYAPDIGRSMGVLVRTIQNCRFGNYGGAPRILLVSPIHIDPNLKDIRPDIYDEFGRENAYPNCIALAGEYEKQARECGCFFMDAAQYAQPGKTDGLHLDAANHRKLGIAISHKVKEIFNEES